MRKILIAPQKYVQGEGELENIGSFIEKFGQKALLVASIEDQARVQTHLDNAVKKGGFTFVSAGFGGEITTAEILRLTRLMISSGCDLVVGLGGGKALDSAKAVADELKTPCIVVPTIASTDAPCSSLAVVYTEEGEFERGIFLARNPDVVLVDTQIIANAPARFLVSGMGDALATYFEARSCSRAFGMNVSGAASTRAAQAIAKECFDILMEDSMLAIAAVEAKVVTMALENVIEANILLSGIGFESGGLGAAHSIHNGLTVLPETHRFFHGEKVAFGVIVQLVLENAPKDEIDRILAYCQNVGLPTSLAQLGVDRTPENVKKVAQKASLPLETIHLMPFKVTSREVFGAILVADAIGTRSIS